MKKKKSQSPATSSYRVSQGNRPTQCNSELLSMEWQLGLRSTAVEVSSGPVPDSYIIYGSRIDPESRKQIIPFVKMVPNPEIAEKLGDVFIVAGKLTLEVNGSTRQVTFSADSPTILRKQSSYVSDLTSKGKHESNLQVGHTSKIDVEIDIYLVGNTLETIEPIDLPPCSLVQDYSKLMPDSEKESKEKFCDVRITCPALTADTKNDIFYAHKAILAA